LDFFAGLFLFIFVSFWFFLFIFIETPAPPKVTDAKIVGDLRENSKVTVTGTVTGGTEGSSRVQWFKSSCSILEGDNSLEELSTSKVAKVG